MKAILICVFLTIAMVSQGVAQQRPDQRDSSQVQHKPNEEPVSPDVNYFEQDDPQEITPIEKAIVYPDSAKHYHIEGKVELDALIAKDGHVEKVKVLKASDPIFVQPSIDAMMKTRFKPAKQNGTPLRIWVSRTINFKLR